MGKGVRAGAKAKRKGGRAKRTRKPTQPKAPSVEDRAAWLMRFLQTDVKSFRVGELIDTSNDAVHYLLDPSSVVAPGKEAEAVAWFREMRDELNETSVPESMTNDEYAAMLTAYEDKGAELVTDDDVLTIQRPTLAQFQSDVRAGLAALHGGKPWTVPNTPAWMLRPLPDGSLHRIYKGTVLAMLVASAAELLTAVWPRVRRCEYAPCSLFFLQTDGRQRYHDAKCSGIARYERFSSKRIPKTNRVSTKRGRK